MPEIDSNGVEVGSLVTGLGGAGLHFGQLDLTNPAFNFTNPGKPVTIRIDSISGGTIQAHFIDQEAFNSTGDDLST